MRMVAPAIESAHHITVTLLFAALVVGVVIVASIASVVVNAVRVFVQALKQLIVAILILIFLIGTTITFTSVIPSTTFT